MIQIIVAISFADAHCDRSQSSIRPGDDSDIAYTQDLNQLPMNSRNPVFALEMIQTFRVNPDGTITPLYVAIQYSPWR